MRPAWRIPASAAASLGLTVALVVSGASGSADLSSDKKAVDAKVSEARDSLEGASREVEEAGTRLAEAEAELELARARTARAQGELAAAEGRLRTALAAEKQARAELDKVRAEFTAAERRVAEAVAQVEGLARAVFTAQVLDPISIALGSESPADFPARMQMIESVANDNDRILRTVNIERAMLTNVRSEVKARHTELDRLRSQAETARSEAAAKATAVARSESEVASLVSSRTGLLSQASALRAREQKRLASLEAESRRLTALIRARAAEATSRRSNGRLAWPTSGGIASGFGMRFHPILQYWRLHAGADIGGAEGNPIWAADDGVVIEAGWSGGYGNLTVISHGTFQGKTLVTAYGHQSVIGVAVGQRVTRGQQIGRVGTTGLSTSPHLHFEVRLNGVAVDPAPWLG